jgi:aerobic carbon-monoxide dehydrogenase large subunit
MTATGIGASVKRKEDKRFITGKGNYTDDISLKDQSFAYFVRSPHAHATIKSINTKKASGMPGVLGVFTSSDVAEDKIGGLICGWTIHSKDGSPMKAGPHPILAVGKVRYVGDHVAVVVAETKAQAKAAAAMVDVKYVTLPHVVDAAKAMSSKAQVHDVANDNRVYNWSLGDEATLPPLSKMQPM